MDDRTSLTVNSLARLVINGASKLVTLIIVILVSRRLGPEGLGVTSFIISSGFLIATVLSLGIPPFLNYILGLEKKGKWVWGSLRIALPLLILNILALPFGLTPYVSFATLVLLEQIILSSFSGLEAQPASLPRSMIRETVRILTALIIIFLLSKSDLVPLAYMLGAAAYVVSSINFFMRLPDPDPVPLREIIMRSFPFFFVGITATLLGHVDAIILFILKGERELGLYRAATSFIYGFLGLLPFMTATFPIIGRRVKEGSDWILKRIVVPVLAVSLLFQGFVYGASFLFPIIYGKKFLMALPTLFLFSCMITISTFFQLGQQTLLALGKNREQIIYNLIGVGTNVILDVIFIPSFGKDGAAVASIVGLLLATFLTWKKVLEENKRSLLIIR